MRHIWYPRSNLALVRFQAVPEVVDVSQKCTLTQHHFVHVSASKPQEPQCALHNLVASPHPPKSVGASHVQIDAMSCFTMATTSTVSSSGRVWALLLLLVIQCAILANGCIHDTLQHSISRGHQRYSSAHPFHDSDGKQNSRRLEQLDGDTTNHQAYDRTLGQAVPTDAYRPIRITPYFDSATLDLLAPDKRSVLSRIVLDAIHQFELALLVVPVEGNLTAQHSCDVEWVTTPATCETLVENETCFEMPIPPEHFGATRKCSTCLNPGCTNGDCTYSSAQGVPDTDFLLYVRAANSSYCTGPVLAFATSCQKDQFDRPTFGMANFCPSHIRTDAHSYDAQVATAMHELTHALGFSAQYFAYMRHSDGTPRTPRNHAGQPNSGRSHDEVQCPNSKEKSPSHYALPGKQTVGYFNERGHTVAKIVTPTVAAFVQAHFNCSSVAGAELESQDGGCLGSHWEERLFESEYMTPVSSFRNVLSGLTFAFFEDSGWYRTNASRAQRLFFGENRGCSFATDKCIDPVTSESVAPDHYCTNSEVESCALDATSRSICTVATGRSNIPTIYQYFASDWTKGGENEFADYCPLNVGFVLGDCTNPDNLATPEGTSINIMGEAYCPTCRCTTTSLRSSDSSAWVVNSRRQTGCYDMQCVGGDTTGTNLTAVEITVARSLTGDAVKVRCSFKGQKLQVPGFTGSVTCPDPLVICGASFDVAASALGTLVDALSEVPASVDRTLRGTNTGSHTHHAVAPMLGAVLVSAWLMALWKWV